MKEVASMVEETGNLAFVILEFHLSRKSEIQCFPGNSQYPVFFEVPTVRMNKVRNF